MTNVLVLGGSGMLGSMVVDVLAADAQLAVTATVRSVALAEQGRARWPQVRWAVFDGACAEEGAGLFRDYEWAVNAIGITKPLIHDHNPAETARALAINSMLPHKLGEIAARTGTTVLQIATDCVYSGLKGAYIESDPHDALDVYGKTKSLGETYLPAVRHLRCSIIGPEPKDFKFLVEWFRRQPRVATVKGFVNHQWNGVTTLQFARVCRGVIRRGIDLPHLHHVVPAGTVSKAEMLHAFAEAFDRSDVIIEHTEAKTVVDRTLATCNASLNEALWSAAGYGAVPSVPEMIAELGVHELCGAAA